MPTPPKPKANPGYAPFDPKRAPRRRRPEVFAEPQAGTGGPKPRQPRPEGEAPRGGERQPRPEGDAPRSGEAKPRRPRPEGDAPRSGEAKPRRPRPEGEAPREPRPRRPRPEGDAPREFQPRPPRPEGEAGGEQKPRQPRPAGGRGPRPSQPRSVNESGEQSRPMSDRPREEDGGDEWAEQRHQRSLRPAGQGAPRSSRGPRGAKPDAERPSGERAPQSRGEPRQTYGDDEDEDEVNGNSLDYQPQTPGRGVGRGNGPASSRRQPETSGRRGRGQEEEGEPQKLHKMLAQMGIGSRRELEEWIVAGRVSVNGLPAHVGQRVGPQDRVKVNGKLLRLRFAPRLPKVLLYHKPEGEIVSRDDPENRDSVFDKLPRVINGRWIAVGRLDFNTSGLLVFTTSGELANQMAHPSSGLEREYAVRVMGELGEEQRETLLDGLLLDDGVAAFNNIRDEGGEGANHWYRVTIGEGRNREVRRMFESVGLMVSRLTRVRYGPLVLPPRLTRGKTLELKSDEILALMKAVGTPASKVVHNAVVKKAIRRQGKY